MLLVSLLEGSMLEYARQGGRAYSHVLSVLLRVRLCLGMKACCCSLHVCFSGLCIEFGLMLLVGATFN